MIDLKQYEFHPSDFTVDGIGDEMAKKYHAHLTVSLRSDTSFFVSSQRKNHDPHIVKHNGYEPTNCTCEWFDRRVLNAINQGDMPVKYCAHWYRVELVFIKKAMRLALTQSKRVQVKPDTDVHGSLNGSRAFNLFK